MVKIIEDIVAKMTDVRRLVVEAKQSDIFVDVNDDCIRVEMFNLPEYPKELYQESRSGKIDGFLIDKTDGYNVSFVILLP